MFTLYKRLFSYIPNYQYLAYLAILLSSLSSALMVMSLYFIYVFLTDLISLGQQGQAFSQALLIVFLMIMASFLYVGSGLISHLVAFRLETNLRKKGIDGLLQSNFSFFSQSSSGKIRKIIDDNAAETHGLVAHLIPDIAGVITTPLLILLLSLFINPYLTLLLFLLVFIGSWLVKDMTGQVELMERYSQALENLNSATVEYVRGIQVIKIFKTSVDSFRALSKAIDSYSRDALNYSFSCRRAYVLFQVLFVVYILFVLTGLLLFVPLAGQLVLLPQILFLFSVLGLLFTCFMKVMYVSMYQYKSAQVLDKIENLYADMTKDRVYQGEEEDLAEASIEFRKVSFAYPDSPAVIKDLSFSLAAKKVYALVGSSGSGKSTLARLLAGFYQPSSGQILLGGKPLESYRQEALMEQVSFVFQEARLFKMSIFDNVQIGKPSASRDQVLKALEEAGCQDILAKFPQREETLIGSKGVHLSGGEKQRIALARAILKDPKLLILDEASASTDLNNEYKIQQAFARLIKDKTVLIIAHRLPSIKGVDEILLMEQGQIVERGSHDFLMEKAGRYCILQELYAQASEWRVL
ncbi:ABC transporter ATP-binding protein [Streptococcus oricebi]|uniref:ABC transporter ATP-binding protein n=1 Tax=Streptococcus oricebi TaxID=1547447 RepID=A0ABS5B5B9_9STRE|nr:ABC transporter ATP-binding protein [Streptococcus oricebi]MBP2624000.1 ABC transporter ATP-binding protein [Streptococcus oricebi]